MSGDAIVISGLGLVLACGDGLEVARRSWVSDQACFSPLPPNLGVGRGAVCAAFNPVGIIPPMQLRRLDRPSRFAWAAAHQALSDAGLDARLQGERIGLAVGTLSGGSEASEVFMRPYFERGPEGASPMVFPNCVANAASGHVALAFGIKGPSGTQLERENATFAALDQGLRWLRRGAADAVLVLGTDGLFPLQLELLRRTGRLCVQGDPLAHGGTGYLPGEGAQAFLLETRDRAEARGAKVRAEVAALVCVAPKDASPAARTEALALAVAEAAGEQVPAAWVGGSNGSRRVDDLEAAWAAQHPRWPAPRFPKLLWGEFCGVGGQLLAAALLEERGSVLVSGPASAGCQYAALLKDIMF